MDCSNWERSPSRLYVVTLLIELTCRVHPEKCWAGCSTSWNQDFWDGDTMNKAAINIVFFFLYRSLLEVCLHFSWEDNLGVT